MIEEDIPAYFTLYYTPLRTGITSIVSTKGAKKNDLILAQSKEPKSGYIQLSPDMKDLHQTRMTLIDLWSIRNYEPYKSSIGPDEYFFGTFGLFSAVTKNHQVELLQELKERASKDTVINM